MNVKQSDIAERLGISRVTVTKALQDSSDISMEMKARVRRVAEEMDYIPNLTARYLNSRKTRTIGVVLPDITNLYFSIIVKGMMEIADKLSYQIILTVSREDNTKESENIFKLLSMNVEGILVCQTLDTVEINIFKKVEKRKIPLVFFARPVGFEGFNSIGFDDYEAAKKMTQFLIDNNKTRIAHISGDIVSDGGIRLEGFLDTMRENKIPIYNDWIIRGKYLPEHGYKGFNKMYKSNNLPEVIFCGNGMIARGVYEAAREKGIKIPEDISVVAIDHQDYSEMLYPRLTHIDYPTRTLGREAMKLIIKKIEDIEQKNIPENIILDTFLVNNESLI